MNLRTLARGQPCKIRLAGICNHNPETTVLAHIRLQGISGMGMKAPDLLGAWACSSCHAWVDSHSDIETMEAFYEGVFRTQNQLIKDGVIEW